MLLNDLYPLSMSAHKDAVAAVNVTRDLVSFVTAYRTEDGLGISALFALDADSEDSPLRELPDYDFLTQGESHKLPDGSEVRIGVTVFEMKTKGMGDAAKAKLRNNMLEQRLMQLADNDRFLAIAINSSAVKKTNCLPFLFSVTPKEFREQQAIRKADQDTARRTGAPIPPDLPAPDVLRDPAWYEKQIDLSKKMLAAGLFASQKNAMYRNRVLRYMAKNYEQETGDRVDGVHALFGVLELATKHGMTKKTISEIEEEYMCKLKDKSGYKELTYAAI